MLPTVKDIIAAIPTFSQKDLRRIYATVGSMLTKIEEPPGDWQDEKSVYQAWRELLQHRYGTRLPEFGIAKTLPMYKRYKLATGAKTVVEFIDHEVSGLRGANRENAIMQCVACCVSSLRARGSSEATAVAAAALRDVAACVDASFPGYAEHGMLGLVLRSRREDS